MLSGRDTYIVTQVQKGEGIIQLPGEINLIKYQNSRELCTKNNQFLT
jgi:hypothetical protein